MIMLNKLHVQEIETPKNGQGYHTQSILVLKNQERSTRNTVVNARKPLCAQTVNNDDNATS